LDFGAVRSVDDPTRTFVDLDQRHVTYGPSKETVDGDWRPPTVKSVN
jgi:hypothetical protein